MPLPVTTSPSILLPEGYLIGEDEGLYQAGELEWRGGKPFQNPPRLIASEMFHMSAVMNGTEGYAYQFQVKKPNEGWKSFSVGAEAAITAGGAGKFAKAGVLFADREAANIYIRKAKEMLEKKDRAIPIVEQMGWIEDRKSPNQFVLGSTLYRDGNPQPAMITQNIRDRASSFVLTGSYEEWKAAVNLLLGTGHHAQAFAFLCGFAAPLMEFESKGEGGAIVCFQSLKVGTGKTTGIQSAASIYGNWKFLNMGDDDSKVGKQAYLTMLKNVPAFYDDLYAMEPNDLRKFVMNFTQGHERARGNTSGGMLRSPYTWSTLLLTTTNSSIIDMVQHAAGNDAAPFRVLEFNCSDNLTVPKEGMDYFKKKFLENYGWAGHSYLKYLTNPHAFNDVKSRLAADRDHVQKTYKFPPRARFYERTITCALTAARIIRTLGFVTNYDLLRCVDWAARYQLQQPWVIRAMKKPDEVDFEAAESLLSKYLFQNAANFVVVSHQVMTKAEQAFVHQLPKTEYAGRVELKEMRLCIIREHFNRWAVKEKVPIRETLAAWKKAEMLMEQRTINVTAGIPHFPVRSTCLIFNGHSVALAPLLQEAVTQVSASRPETPPKA